MAGLTNILFKNNVLALVLGAAVTLSGCLPDDQAATSLDPSIQSVNDRQVISQALNFLEQSQKITQNILQDETIKTTIFSDTSQPGMINVANLGISASSNVRSAYCVQNNGGDLDKSLITWMTSDDQRHFALKGIGYNAGQRIAQSLSKSANGLMVGVGDGANVVLLSTTSSVGTATSQEQFINVAQYCGGITIPKGAPVLVNQTVDTVQIENITNTEEYEYRSVKCPAGSEGFQIYRKLKNDDNAPWMEHQTGDCQVQENLSFAAGVTIRSFVGGYQQAGAAEQDLLKALENLPDVDCVVVGASENLADTNVRANDCQIETIDTPQMEIISGNNYHVHEHVIINTERRTNICLPGDPTISLIVNGSPVTATTSGWTGQMTFVRHHYAVDETSTEYDDQLRKKGKWLGETLNCARDETFTVSCSALFPAYTAPTYTALTAGNVTITRTATYDGWKTPETLMPNAITHSNWVQSNSCSWEMREDILTEACPAGQSGDIVTTRVTLVSVDPMSGTEIRTQRTETQNNCLPPNTGGLPVCGSAINTCSIGTFSNSYIDPSTGMIWWECANEGISIHCTSVTLDQASVCGTPQTCFQGSVVDVADTPTETRWMCYRAGNNANGENSDVMCSVSTAPASTINGQCGGAINQCIDGTFSDVLDTGTDARWACTGANGGTDASCSEPLNISGVTCPAMPWDWESGMCRASAPETPAGQSISITNTTPGYSGTKTLTCGADGTWNNDNSHTCVLVAPPINGQCGPADNQTTTGPAPTTGLCDAGTAQNMGYTAERYPDGTPMMWWYQCVGEYGGTTDDCSTPIQPPSGPVCGTMNSCVNGVYKDSWDTDRMWWECRVGGGTGSCASDPDCIHCEAPFNSQCTANNNEGRPECTQ